MHVNDLISTSMNFIQQECSCEWPSWDLNSLGGDGRGGVSNLGHVDLQYELERLFDDSIRHAGTHINGTVVVSANGLVGARPVVGLLVHLDRHGITGCTVHSELRK